MRLVITAARWLAVLPASFLGAYLVLRITTIGLFTQASFVATIGLVLASMLTSFVFVLIGRTTAPDAKVATGFSLAVLFALGLAPLFIVPSANRETDIVLSLSILAAAGTAFLPFGPKSKTVGELPAVVGWLLFLPIASGGALLTAIFLQYIVAEPFRTSGLATDLESRFMVVLVFIATLGALLPAAKRTVVSIVCEIVLVFGVYLIASGLAGMHVIPQFTDSSTLGPEAKDIQPVTVVFQGLASVLSATIPLLVVNTGKHRSKRYREAKATEVTGQEVSH